MEYEGEEDGAVGGGRTAAEGSVVEGSGDRVTEEVLTCSFSGGETTEQDSSLLSLVFNFRKIQKEFN